MLVRSLQLPTARTSDLVVSESGKDVLVFDQQSNQIHHLNATAATVWRACDGRRPVEDIALHAGVPAEAARMAVAQLQLADLLEGTLTAPGEAHVGSRRALLRRVGVAGAVALPAIVSVTAPAAAQIPSCTPSGEPCLISVPSACCSRACRLTTDGYRCV